jgi:hypothetical protein
MNKDALSPIWMACTRAGIYDRLTPSIPDKALKDER